MRTVIVAFFSLATFVSAVGTLSLTPKVDNIGWRPADLKVAIFTQNPGATVEVRSSPGDAVAFTVPSVTYSGVDADSGDKCWLADFSGLTAEGTYYVYSPSLGIRSYDFDIGAWVYNPVGEAVVKSFYYQRCNFKKEDPYSGPWQDAVCHASDFAMTRWEGGDLAGHGWVGSQPDYGTLDLHGGWHDAGDYQKTPHWDRGVVQMLWAYDVNPAAWPDGGLNIPESGNGVPDILDEISWELDFYVRCQRPDGHFLSSASGHDGNTPSPPSANNEIRGYVDQWPDEATARSTAKLAHASFLYRRLGQTAKADLYETAALDGWAWLAARSLSGNNNKLKCAAAAAVWRMDPTVAAAKAFVEAWPSWTFSWNPQEDVLTAAIWQYLSCSNTSAGVVTAMRSAVGNGVVNTVFGVQDVYAGLQGDPGNGWDWCWGSNRNHSAYGFNLMMARYFGIYGSRTSDQIRDQAQKYLHYILGRNTMSMVYLSSMESYGGEHSVFQFYHSWFGYWPNTPGDGGGHNPLFNGKPSSATEPFYPYYAADNQTSLYGPAPGILVGGPNFYYTGTYSPPDGATRPAKAYRDFSVGCDWGGGICRASSWEITENSLGYSGPLVGLCSFFMSPGGPSAVPSVKASFVTNLSQVSLVWTRAQSSGTLTYKTVRSASGFAFSTNDSGAATNAVDSAVDRGRTYRYRVLAYTNGAYFGSSADCLFEPPPFRIRDFTALLDPGDKSLVALSWTPLAGIPGAQYKVVRGPVEDSPARTNAAGSTNSATETVPARQETWTYRILAFTNGLCIGRSADADVAVPAPENRVEVRQNYIRPSRGETFAELRIEVAADATKVVVDIFSIGGERVKTGLVNATVDAGLLKERWFADNDDGRPVASGTYIAVARIGGTVQIRKKIIVVR
jgi:hypothetical protein